MAMTQRPVVGVFDNQEHAENAIDQLHQAGFTDNQIGFAVRGRDVAAEIGTVDLNFAAQLRAVGIVNLRAHRFAQFMQQHEAALRVNVEVADDL